MRENERFYTGGSNVEFSGVSGAFILFAGFIVRDAGVGAPT